MCLRATPQATLLAKALHEWDTANEVYANAVPMLCWLSPDAQSSGLCEVRSSERAQRQASLDIRDHFRHTRHTRRVNVRLRGRLTLLPPIESEPITNIVAPPGSLAVGATSSAAATASRSDAQGGHPDVAHASGGGSRSHRKAVLVVPPPPPRCAVCGVREGGDHDADANGWGAESAGAGSPRGPPVSPPGAAGPAARLAAEPRRGPGAGLAAQC